MKNFFKRKLILIVFFLITNSVFSQTISIGSDTAVVGEDILIPINVNGLLNIGSIDLKIKYDSTVLVFIKDTLQSTDASGVLLNSTFNNGIFKQINVSWLASGISGVNIANGNFLYLKFNYLGGTTNLNFVLSLCEINDWDSNPIIANYINGYVVPSLGANISVWNGNGNWSNSFNWNNGIPGIITDAVINTGNVEINSNSECNNIIIENGSNLRIYPNKSFTIYGNLTIKGNIFILSDSTGSGSFINHGNINGNGNITVEKYLSKSNFNDFIFITSPVANTNSSAPVFNNTILQMFSETNQSWQNLSGNTILQQGTGYLIKSDTSRIYTFTDSVIVHNSLNFNNLTLSNNIGNNIPNGFNLIGNPYTCALDWNNSNWIKNNIDASIYTFNGINYVSYNGEIGSFIDGIIPSLQGFFVKVNATNPFLFMPDTARMHNVQLFYKSNNNINDLLIIKAEGNNYNDITYLYFKSGATKLFDKNYDAYKLFGINEAPQVYTVLEDLTKLSINVIDSVKENLSVKVGFKVGIAGIYSLNFENQTSFAPSVKMFLEDTKNGTITNLRTNPLYIFTAEANDILERFNIYFSDPTLVNENKSPDEIIVFSNNKQLYIQSNEFLSKSKLYIFDILGKCVKEIELNGNKMVCISLSDLSSGNYIVKFVNERKSFVKKVNLNN